jgi:hypothetical protein
VRARAVAREGKQPATDVIADDAEYLEHELAGRAVVKKRLRAVGRDEVDAALLEETPAGLLHEDVACEAARRLDDDCLDAVTLDPLD